MQELKRLYGEIAACFPGRALVFGDGPINPRLMLIGEAPGAREVEEGRPFVGKAGKNLDEFLEFSGLSRRDIFIGNVVKFRPTKPSKATGRLVNRPPTPKERNECKPWLMREIEIVAPGIIATLGNSPLKTLLGEGESIGAAHGRLIRPPELPPVFPLYHPASVIYNRALRGTYLRDLQALRELLAENPEK